MHCVGRHAAVVSTVPVTADAAVQLGPVSATSEENGRRFRWQEMGITASGLLLLRFVELRTLSVTDYDGGSLRRITERFDNYQPLTDCSSDWAANAKQWRFRLES